MPRVLRTILLTACLAALLPGIARAHIRLESATPAVDETITAPPDVLRLRFSGFIEPKYTSLLLIAPDGSTVPLGAVTFVTGSDREFTAAVPRLRSGGTFTVRWRTAGADGHVLEGSYTFTLALDSAALDPVDTLPAVPVPAQPAPADAHDHGGGSSGVGPAEVLGRWLQFVALTLLLGSVTVRSALLPRLSLDGSTAGVVRRGAWHGTALAAVLLGVAAIVRLWTQSAAMHGAERAWSTPLLTMMLNDTAWGRAWVLQVFLLTLLGAAIVWARPGRDRIATWLALFAAIALCAIPGLSGHAAGVAGAAWLVLANDTLHVAAAGAWIGTLALLILRVLPALGRSAEGSRLQADAVDSFSPIALSAAGVVALTGVINALMHFDALTQLWATSYGQALLVKLLFVAAAVGGGFVNWRVIRPRLGGGDVARLRIVAGSELFFALLVLLATAVLTGLPRPG